VACEVEDGDQRLGRGGPDFSHHSPPQR
jgi:hypothetical protein